MPRTTTRLSFKKRLKTIGKLVSVRRLHDDDQVGPFDLLAAYGIG
jgi:hypothetical protein